MPFDDDLNADGSIRCPKCWKDPCMCGVQTPESRERVRREAVRSAELAGATPVKVTTFWQRTDGRAQVLAIADEPVERGDYYLVPRNPMDAHADD